MARIHRGIRRGVAMVLGAYARLGGFLLAVHDHCHHHAMPDDGLQNHLFMIANNPAGNHWTIISWRRRCFISRWFLVACLAQGNRLKSAVSELRFRSGFSNRIALSTADAV